MDGTRARGIDVNHDHPVTSWVALMAAPEDVAFIGAKVSQGATFTDQKFRDHRAGFLASNLELAIYFHYAEPGDARAQARRYRDLCGDLTGRERMCLDLERAPGLTLGNLSLDWVAAWYDELAGLQCGPARMWIYTSKNQYGFICGGKPWPYGTSEVELWNPRYSPQADLEPEVPPPWSDRGWLVWQFSDGETPPHAVPGVGLCDGNVWNGNRASLRSYVQASSVAAPPAPANLVT
jgi:hypothetical protein